MVGGGGKAVGGGGAPIRPAAGPLGKRGGG